MRPDSVFEPIQRPAVLIASAVCMSGLAAVVCLYLSVWLAVWIVFLAALTHRFPDWGVATLFAVLSLDVARPVFGTVFVSFSEFELAACLLAAAAGLAGGRHGVDGGRPRFDWRPLLWGAPFLAAVALSGFANIAAYKVGPHVLRNGAMILAMSLAASVFARSRKAMGLGVPAAILIYAGIGLAQVWRGESLRVSSAFSNPNQFSGYLVLIVSFPAVFLLSASSARQAAGWAAMSALSIVALLFTGSRSGLAATLAALAAAVVGLRRHRPPRASAARGRRASGRIWPLAVGGMVLIVVLTAFGVRLLPPHLAGRVSRLAGRYLPASLSQTADTRLALFRLGSRMWADHPWVGVGPGRYADVYPAYAPAAESEVQSKLVDHARRRWGDDAVRVRGFVESRLAGFRRTAPIHLHNLFLQLAVDFGLLGLLAFAGFWALVARAFFRGGDRGPWEAAGFAASIGFLIHNLADVTFPALGPELGLLLGAALVRRGGSPPVRRASGDEQGGAGPPTRGPRPFAQMLW